MLKEGKYVESSEVYLEALCAFNFEGESKETVQDLNLRLKVPILNNLVLLLMKRNLHANAAVMADQVFEIDPDNFKAHLRKAESLVVIEELAKAEKEIEICQSLAKERAEKLEVQEVLKKYKQKESKE